MNPREDKPTGGLFFVQRVVKHGNMLIRAALISVLLHLGLLLSPTFFVDASLQGNSVYKPTALSVIIDQNNGSDMEVSSVQKSVTSGAKSPTIVHRLVSSNGVLKSYADFGYFSPSTIGFPKQRGKEERRPVEAGASESQSASAEVISEYRLNVARAARKYYSYPVLARDNGWEGVVNVSIVIAIGSRHPMVTLASSSGHDALDRQAIEMVERAVSLAKRPDGLYGTDLTVSLPVEFSLSN